MSNSAVKFRPTSSQDNALSSALTSGFAPLLGVGFECGGPVELGGHFVGGVAVQVVPGAVVAAGGAGVGVAHGVLEVLQRHAVAEQFGGLAYLPWIRSIAWSERIFGVEAREAR